MQGMDKPLHFIAVFYIYDNLVKWLYRPYFLKWYGRKRKINQFTNYSNNYLMDIQTAKQIRIADYLHSLGYSPVKQQVSTYGINHR